MEGRVFEMFLKNRKNFKSLKMPKIVPKSVQTCFEQVLRVLFSKTFFAQSSVPDRVFEMFLIKIFFQNSKNAQNRSQKCPIVFWTCFGGTFFRKFFFAQCSMEGRFFEMFSKSFQNSKNAQNLSQKCPIVFWTCFGGTFRKNFLPSVPWWVESSKCFQKI